MSFTSKTKEEIIDLKLNKAEVISEASAIIKNIGIIKDSIKVTTENEINIITNIIALFSFLFDFSLFLNIIINIIVTITNVNIATYIAVLPGM